MIPFFCDDEDFANWTNLPLIFFELGSFVFFYLLKGWRVLYIGFFIS